MTQAVIGALAPTMLRRAIPGLTRRLRTTFEIEPIFHDLTSFKTSPGASVLQWNPAVPPEITAGRFNNNPSTLLELALELIGHADVMKTRKDPARWGEVHILKSGGAHSYTHVGPWVEELSATPGKLNEFRELMHCFPSSLGELPDPRLVNQPGLLGWLMDTKEKQREQQEQYDAIEAYRKQRWTADDGVLGPYYRLGVSSIIRIELFSEVYDETRQLLIRCGTMGTTDYHVFDGRYGWITITDLAKKRTLLAGVGGGRHPIAEMDEINPIGGAAVLSTTFQSYVVARKHGIDPSKHSKEQLDLMIGSHDADLAFRRQLMSQGDAWGVGMATSRQLLGSILKAEEEAMHKLIR
jgi:hypothetical protein